MRIDKFLWSVRLFKTRNIASEFCKKGKILIDDYPVKPSRLLKKGDVFMVKKNPVTYTYKVKSLLKNRVGAKLVENYIENLTTKDEMEKLENQKMAYIVMDKGVGRPTKKDRRDLKKILKS